MAGSTNASNFRVNINNIVTDLNNKADADLTNISPAASVASILKDAGIICVVESYHDNEGNWYRVYSDGWCEQGGTKIPSGSQATTVTVELLKPFKDTSYFVAANYGASSSNMYGQCYDLTTSSFTLRGYGGTSHQWEAKGFIS